MPLFFIIAIAAGAVVVGATTADVAGSSTQAQALRAQANGQQMQQQGQLQTFRTMEECRQAMLNQGLSPDTCRQT